MERRASLAAPPGESAAGAYERIAASYDEDTRGDEWMRSILLQHYLRVFVAGDRVLDVACGTGTDAVYLARRGIQVLGIDGSYGMVARAQAKAADAGVGGLVDVRTLDARQLDQLEGAFDGIVSAFAGLSTLPDLAPFADQAARLLRPGGRMILHLLSRASLWEWMGLVARGQWTAAAALPKCRARTFTIGGQSVVHHMRLPGEARQAFGGFNVREVYALGSLRPPHTVRRIPPRLVATLGTLERPLGGRRPLLNLGRFFVLDLEKR